MPRGRIESRARIERLRQLAGGPVVILPLSELLELLEDCDILGDVLAAFITADVLGAARFRPELDRWRARVDGELTKLETWAMRDLASGEAH